MMQKQINFAQWIQPGSGRPERPSFELACLLVVALEWSGETPESAVSAQKAKIFVMVNLEEEPRPFGLSGDELR